MMACFQPLPAWARRGRAWIALRVTLVGIMWLASVLSSPVYAAGDSIDYVCLKQCSSDHAERSAQDCLNRCRYGDAGEGAASSEAGSPPSGDAHNVFEAPRPIAKGTLYSARPSQAAGTTERLKDYACIQKCQRQGRATAMCEKWCPLLRGRE